MRLVAELRLQPRARLRAKLMVFDRRTHLRRFWREALDTRLPRGAFGAVNALTIDHLLFDKQGRQTAAWLEVDPHYFAVIGLSLRECGIEAICHEAVHAAFAYSERRGRRSQWYLRGELDEETVCYPAGKIAQAINALFHKEGLWELRDRLQRRR